ncbi:hypothetical protein BPP43_03850 [Brachyspira pilosicoli P43/6/78]|uniref:Uncharacterized protein n=1 Tax=Brachyspira pilosicoli P43/6/78 TaxID=1042417 RepID=A0A3B6VND8_BRAPL|nr:hypothetical protein [Brachyspira pilosicoli]AGA66062.1 hypothetical protein BPP43_03850 [Brachyspira pilosicoli P43/6/78]MBW5382343.1 hypothetical protein [Brachyspira pilosicoli]
MFELIYEPSCIPLTLEEAYKKQNYLLKHIRFLHTAFEGIKIDFSNNSKMPFIKKGSICMFCYSLYEAKEDIILNDNTNSESNKYILLKLINNGQNLEAQVVNSLDCYYNEELGGFYLISSEGISKYIPLVITKAGYYQIDYFNMYNNEVS